MAEPRAHVHGFDWLRVAGIAGVVWIHGCDTNALARRWSSLAAFAVPVFVLMSFFLVQRSLLNHGATAPLPALLRRRFARLLPAYLVWSLAYLLIRWLKHRFLGSQTEALNPLSALLSGGASYQLYFVAALIYWSPFALPLALLNARLAGDRLAGAVIGNAVLGGGLLLAAAWLRHWHTFPPHLFLLQQMVAFSGFVPLGMAGALWVHRRTPSPLLLRIGVAAGLTGVVWLFAGPVGSIALVSSLAFFVWGMFACVSPAPAPVRAVAAWSYGIFLVHGFFLEGLQLLFARASLPLPTLGGTVTVIVLAFLLSCLLCALLNRIPRLRWLVA